MSTLYVDCTSLPGEWDSADEIRNRLRSNQQLVSNDGGKDVKIQRCVANYDVLIPILTQIGCGCRLAEIEGLREAVGNVYARNQREPTTDIVDDDAWSVRDMVFFVKRKTQRQEVSLVDWFLKFLWCFLLVLFCICGVVVVDQKQLLVSFETTSWLSFLVLFSWGSSLSVPVPSGQSESRGRVTVLFMEKTSHRCCFVQWCDLVVSQCFPTKCSNMFQSCWS